MTETIYAIKLLGLLPQLALGLMFPAVLFFMTSVRGLTNKPTIGFRLSQLGLWLVIITLLITFLIIPGLVVVQSPNIEARVTSQTEIPYHTIYVKKGSDWQPKKFAWAWEEFLDLPDYFLSRFQFVTSQGNGAPVNMIECQILVQIDPTRNGWLNLPSNFGVKLLSQVFTEQIEYAVYELAQREANQLARFYNPASTPQQTGFNDFWKGLLAEELLAGFTVDSAKFSRVNF